MPLLLAALLLWPASSARADDLYAPLKPLLGTWLVNRQCGTYKDKVLVVIRRLPKTVLAEFRDPKNPKASWGRADVINSGEEDHYRVVAALPNNQMLITMGIKSVAGSLVVSDDPDEPDGPGNDYITISSRVSVLSTLLTIKLRDDHKKATFFLKTETPLGGQTCRGEGAKQPAKK